MDTKIGFLGAGNMAQSLSKGFLDKGLVKAENIIASVSDIKKAGHRKIQDCGVRLTASNAEVVRESHVIFIAVKPHIVPVVLSDVSGMDTSGKLFISIAAGVSLDTLSRMLPQNTHIVRSMPNTPCCVLSGAIAYTPGPVVTPDECATVEKLFGAVGLCLQLPEHLIDSVCGLSGSGPAFGFIAIEAMSDGGVKMGLPRKVATQLAAQTLLGAAQMVLSTGRHPGELKDAVCSPGGTTISGVHALERGQMRATMIDAIEAATLKAREMGKQ